MVGSVAAYGCSSAARWLPRVLAGAILAAGLTVALVVDPAEVVVWSRPFKTLVAVLGGLAALWIVRKGGEVRLTVTPRAEAIEFRYGRQERRLRYEDIASLEYSPAFGPSRSWMPAMVIIDRAGRIWRVPAVIESGERLLGEVLRRAGRHDLRAWADARNLAPRLARAPRVLAAGYTAAGVVLSAAIAFLVSSAGRG